MNKLFVRFLKGASKRRIEESTPRKIYNPITTNDCINDQNLNCRKKDFQLLILNECRAHVKGKNHPKSSLSIATPLTKSDLIDTR